MLALETTHLVQRYTEPVPSAMGETMSTALGIDLRETRVRRGREARAAARALEARAFARGADVYLPASEGSLESPPVQALLAHELTHVAQQHRFGPALPVENSPEGVRLENQARAQAAAWEYRDLPFAPRIRFSPTLPGAAASDDRTEPVAARLVTDSIEPSPQETTSSGSSASTGSDALVSMHSSPATQRAPIDDLASAAPQPSHSDQPGLDELARQLYDRIRVQLRSELLVDRERAGLVTDLR